MIIMMTVETTSMMVGISDNDAIYRPDLLKLL